MQEQVIIIDYGSQYTKILLRKIKELAVNVKIVNPTITVEELKKYSNLKAVILSGGYHSVNDKTSYQLPNDFFNLNVAVLGICYGMQLLVDYFNGVVKPNHQSEYGKSLLTINSKDDFFTKIENNSQVWMSHADSAVDLGNNLITLATTDNNTNIAVIRHKDKPFYGIQFHCEVNDTIFGKQMLNNFLFKIAKLKSNVLIDNLVNQKIDEIKSTVGQDQVILAFSGGVDSTVAAFLIKEAIGSQLTCILVDTGLLRDNEVNEIVNTYKNLLPIKVVDAQELFYRNLKGIINPEEKRKIIGKTFIDVLEQEAKKINGVKFLAQGTIASDVIESGKGNSQTIKSHHNVGGLPEKLNLILLEPLKDNFKDEVRMIATNHFQLDNFKTMKHPFPGVGLAIRIIGEVNEEKSDILRRVDKIFIDSLKSMNLYDQVGQAFAVLLPIKTVGVTGDNRNYQYTVALRAVNSQDFMTADFSQLSWDFLKQVANQITNQVKEVNRVTYDITSKPPATIEWE